MDAKLGADAPRLGSHKGQPAIFIPDSRWTSLANPFRWALVGKFSKGYNRKNSNLGRPSVEKLQSFFGSLDLRGGFSIGLLDNRHLLIRLSMEEDFLRLYSRMIWSVSNSITMRIFKWSPDFHIEKESSLVPLWLNFPRLPIHLFNRDMLFQIASLIGLPLRLDSATSSLKRPSVARLQVEIDLLRPRPNQVWIGVGERDGFWQSVDYENVPPYCKLCWHVGHEEAVCRSHNQERHKQIVSKAPAKEYVPVTTPAAPKTIEAPRSDITGNPTLDPDANVEQINHSAVVLDSVVNPSVQGGPLPSHISQHTDDESRPQPARQNVSQPLSGSVARSEGERQNKLLLDQSAQEQATAITTAVPPPVVMESTPAVHQPENGAGLASASSAPDSIPPNQVFASVNASPNSIIIHPLPRIFCADSDPEEKEEILIPIAPSYSSLSPQSDLNSLSTPTPNDPLATFTLTSKSDFPLLKSPVLVHNPNSTIQLKRQSAEERQSVEHKYAHKQLNVEATAWYPKDHGKSVQEFSSRPGRTLPQSFQQIYDLDAPDDDYKSWHTVNSAEEDEEEEDSGREDSFEEFLDSQYVRDDSYLDERRNRQARRDRETLLMRRGRGRPLGSRNITYLDADFPTTTRQSDRRNKGVPPKHYEPGQ